MIELKCDHCGFGMLFSDDKYGKHARCRSCKSVVKVMPSPLASPEVPEQRREQAPVMNTFENSHATVSKVVVNNVVPLQQRPSKFIYFLFWFFLGGLGAHRFYAGDNGMGIALVLSLVAVVVTGGLWLLPHMIWVVIIEGIILLLRRDLS